MKAYTQRMKLLQAIHVMYMYTYGTFLLLSIEYIAMGRGQ